MLRIGPWRHRSATAAAVLLLMLTVAADSQDRNQRADRAAPRTDANSMAAHRQLLDKTKQGRIDIYFVGDSIVRRWGALDYPELLANWKENFHGWNAANFGWGGDRTQNILWRLENGELDGVNPKVIVVLAGTNNVGAEPRDERTVNEIARGVKAIIDICRAKAPNATIVLTAIFPRNDNIAVMPTIDHLNQTLATYTDGKRVRFLDIRDRFANADGTLLEGVMHDRDKLHPTLKGYQIWADALKPIFHELLGPPAATDLAPPPTGDPSRTEATPAKPEEIALGLSLQGSYSQTKVKEPAYGGHASAMGPAPASAPADPTPSPVIFEEAPRLPTRTFGGGPTKDHILESGGSGVALLDYDGDGRLDIYLVTAAELTRTRQRVPHRNALYRNLGGWKFEDVSQRAGVDAAAWGNGVCAGDVDDDGRLDLYVTNWGANFLFRNRGDGTFEEVAARAGVASDGWSTGCTFFDADADGDLDLYVARYVHTTWDEVVRAQRTLVWRDGPRIMVGPAGLPGESDLFFENLGDGRFVEAASAHGLADAARAYGFGVVATDYDDDGFVDLFVANDSNPNFLYRNLGNGRFESVGLLAGVAVNDEARAQAGMGADAGDYDGDNRTDFVLTAFAHDRNTVYRNIDGRRFEDASVSAGLAASTFVRMGWGTSFLDADLDGSLDLFVANGHIFADIDDYPKLGESYRQKNQLLLNVGGRFRDVSETAGGGLQVARVGRGLAVGDLDDDGDLDLVVSNMDEPPTLLENRQRTGHHWIAFRVVSPNRNRFAIGAKVTVRAGDDTQFREIRSGGSYLSQSDLRPHFGLGDAAGPVTVEVRMPGGRRWRWQGLAHDRLHVLELEESARVADVRRSP